MKVYGRLVLFWCNNIACQRTGQPHLYHTPSTFIQRFIYKVPTAPQFSGMLTGMVQMYVGMERAVVFEENYSILTLRFTNVQLTMFLSPHVKRISVFLVYVINFLSKKSIPWYVAALEPQKVSHPLLPASESSPFNDKIDALFCVSFISSFVFKPMFLFQLVLFILN